MHITPVVEVIERGVVLIFIPLLTLLADVLVKFTNPDQRSGDAKVQHLDELFGNNKSTYNSVLQCIWNLWPNTASTLFVFLSLQFLS